MTIVSVPDPAFFNDDILSSYICIPLLCLFIEDKKKNRKIKGTEK